MRGAGVRTGGGLWRVPVFDFVRDEVSLRVGTRAARQTATGGFRNGIGILGTGYGTGYWVLGTVLGTELTHRVMSTVIC